MATVQKAKAERPARLVRPGMMLAGLILESMFLLAVGQVEFEEVRGEEMSLIGSLSRSPLTIPVGTIWSGVTDKGSTGVRLMSLSSEIDSFEVED